MARTKQTACNSTRGNAPIKEPRKSVRQLHHLCIRFMHYRNLGNSVVMVGKVNKLLEWFNRHNNDIAFFKAATVYTAILMAALVSTTLYKWMIHFRSSIHG